GPDRPGRRRRLNPIGSAIAVSRNAEEAPMLLSARDLERFTIHATDGDIGGVHDVLFDDESWTIRYLVVDTGTWLPGRRGLISPMSVRQAGWGARRLVVGLPREQVEHSPSLDETQPISRQHELAYAGYYGLEPYWAGPYRWGPLAYPFPLPAAEPGVEPAAAEALRREGLENVGPEHLESRDFHEEHGDAHLPGVRETSGYYIQAADGDIGHAVDFLLDDRTWAIRYLIVDTRNWLPGRKVLVAPEQITDLSWADSMVHVSLTRDQIRSSPEYDPSRPRDPDEERPRAA